MLKKNAGVLLIVILMSYAVSGEEAGKDSVLLTLPNIDWALSLESADFVLGEKGITEDGKIAHFQGRDRKTGIIVSAFLEERPESGTAEQCRDFYWEKGKKSPFKKDDIVQSNFGEMATVEYIVKEYMKVEVNQKNLNAYLTRGKFWMDVHLSKADYKESDKEQFDSILKSIRIADNKQSRKIITKYQIDEEGMLGLEVPTNWFDEVWQESKGTPVRIVLTPMEENACKLLITVLWNRKGDDTFSQPENIKKRIEEFGNNALPQAVEDKLDIKEMKREFGIGYFFTLTDKSPEPDGYKYLTQGAYGTGKWLLVFTILNNEEGLEKTALDVIAGSMDLSQKTYLSQ